MEKATLTSKGQVTLPARLRKALGLKAGSEILFEREPDGRYTMRKKTGDVSELKGILQAPAGVLPATEEDIDNAVAGAMMERFNRSRS